MNQHKIPQEARTNTYKFSVTSQMWLIINFRLSRKVGVFFYLVFLFRAVCGCELIRSKSKRFTVNTVKIKNMTPQHLCNYTVGHIISIKCIAMYCLLKDTWTKVIICTRISRCFHVEHRILQTSTFAFCVHVGRILLHACLNFHCVLFIWICTATIWSRPSLDYIFIGAPWAVYCAP